MANRTDGGPWVQIDGDISTIADALHRLGGNRVVNPMSAYYAVRQLDHIQKWAAACKQRIVETFFRESTYLEAAHGTFETEGTNDD